MNKNRSLKWACLSIFILEMVIFIISLFRLIPENIMPGISFLSTIIIGVFTIAGLFISGSNSMDDGNFLSGIFKLAILMIVTIGTLLVYVYITFISTLESGYFNIHTLMTYTFANIRNNYDLIIFILFLITAFFTVDNKFLKFMIIVFSAFVFIMTFAITPTFENFVTYSWHNIKWFFTSTYDKFIKFIAGG